MNTDASTSTENGDTDLATSSAAGRLLAYFGSENCGQCFVMFKTIAEFAASQNEVAANVYDVEEHSGLAAELGVRGVPALFLFDRGALVWSHDRYLSVQDLESKIEGVRGLRRDALHP